MPCPARLSVALLSLAAMCCAGCELPHGPLRWDPVDWHHMPLLPRGELQAPGPFQVTDDCEDHPAPSCQQQPHPAEVYDKYGYDKYGTEPRGPRLTHHHHAVPLAGPGIDAPWPKFHPVPTRPVFESQCLVPVPESAQRDQGVVLLNGQSERQ
jgi:hypothetical protein